MDINKFGATFEDEHLPEKNNEIPISKIPTPESDDQEDDQEGDQVYDMFFQFDEDDVQLLYSGIDVTDPFVIRFNGPGRGSVLTFTSRATGKIFKLFAKGRE
jgi:hypothetical protein